MIGISIAKRSIAVFWLNCIGFNLEWCIVVVFKETLYIFQIICSTGWWQGIDNKFAIAFGMQACIKNCHYAAIFVGAKQTTQTLLQSQYCLGKNVITEPIFSAGFHSGDSRFVDRIIRRVKRHLIDDDQR